VSTYTIPHVITAHPRGDRVMDVYSHLLNERIVYLGTPVDDGVSNALIAQILHLEHTEPDREINLYINSPGGSLPATFAVYDAMQFVRSPVATTCIGQACSTAAILLASLHPRQRGVRPGRLRPELPVHRRPGRCGDSLAVPQTPVSTAGLGAAITSRGCVQGLF